MLSSVAWCAGTRAARLLGETERARRGAGGRVLPAAMPSRRRWNSRAPRTRSASSYALAGGCTLPPAPPWDGICTCTWQHGQAARACGHA